MREKEKDGEGRTYWKRHQTQQHVSTSCENIFHIQTKKDLLAVASNSNASGRVTTPSSPIASPPVSSSLSDKNEKKNSSQLLYFLYYNFRHSATLVSDDPPRYLIMFFGLSALLGSCSLGGDALGEDGV